MASTASSSTTAETEAHPEEESHAPVVRSTSDLFKLGLGALGVVYGDIGTSPLYAIKECVNGPHAVAVTPTNIFGVVSLIFWSLTLVIALKYLTFITRADNHGEGGTLSLFALIMPKGNPAQRQRVGIVTLMLAGLFGAGLLMGEGVITPAISVLSAIEGLEVRTSVLSPFVVPITVVILVTLFLVQRHGTGGIGRVFGWVTLLWFLAIAAAGIPAIVAHPQILGALNPVHAVRFFLHNGWHGFFVLGAVVLVITGGEALYADMGHFGRKPIRTAWYAVVMPALLLNYFGQGALLLEGGPSVVKNPFYSLTPGWTLYPMLLIATLATIVASQALISGVFSLVRQAVQLGYWPRVRIVHTSGLAAGQIYIPEINWALMVACVALVVGFGSSSNLAAAYGTAVTGTMSITSILFYAVARQKWEWSRGKAGALVGLFLLVDLAFFSANINKLPHGGWFPLAVGAGVFILMTTWRRGRSELGKVIAEQSLPLQLFLDDVAVTKPHRVKGTAVFMTSNVDGAPVVLLHHFKHNKVLHEQVVLLSVVTERIPAVRKKHMVEVKELEHGFYQVIAHFGFMQNPDVMMVLRLARREGLKCDPATTSFYLGRETLLVTGRSKMARWRKILFTYLSRNSRPATAFFGLPPNRVVEMGAQIEL